jgi:hypothetical protein
MLANPAFELPKKPASSDFRSQQLFLIHRCKRFLAHVFIFKDVEVDVLYWKTSGFKFLFA